MYIEISVCVDNVVNNLYFSEMDAGISECVLESDIAVVYIEISVWVENIVDSLYFSETENIKNIFFK